MKLTVTCQECKRELSAIRSNHFAKKCTGRIQSKEEYLRLYPGAETMSEARRAACSVTEVKFIKRLGEEEGKKQWQEYCQKLSNNNSFEYFQEKRGWSREQFSAYGKSRAVTLENLINRHGEEDGTKKFAEYCEKQRKNGNTLEYFTEKLGEEDGIKKYEEVCKQKGNTRENMIRVHGEDGEEKHLSWLRKTTMCYTSNKANEFIQQVTEKLVGDFKIHSALHGGEFCIYNEAAHLYDFVITSPIKLAIEFNGDFWHANPKNYARDQILNHRGGNRIAGDIWAYDEHKRKLLENRGFLTMTIWESDYNLDKMETINKVIQWIYQNVK